jgi:nitroreductase
LSDEQTVALLEAARWAPSGNNIQPWRLAIARRDDDLFQTLIEALAGFNKTWTPAASALMVIAVDTLDADGKPRKWGMYEAGLAAAAVTVQATALDLVVHQMAGFSPAAVTAALGLADHVEPVIVMAIGTQVSAETLDGEIRTREELPRSRHELSKIVLHGLPEKYKS